jgi:hypothetical protein
MRTHPEVLKPAAQIVASGLETLLKAAGGFEPGAIECADTLLLSAKRIPTRAHRQPVSSAVSASRSRQTFYQANNKSIDGDRARGTD